MDTILSFFTSNDSDNLPNVIPSRDIFLQTETYNKFTGGAEYNKNTYIGHLKIKNGGMKIIKDEHDKLIGKERNIVLKHLYDSLKAGNLDHTNIELYYKALEGGFIRALMCPGNNNDATCELANYNNEKSAYKLSKHALKGGNLKVLKTFKHNAPKLYQHLKGSGQIKKLKYKRDKYQNRLSDGGSVKSDSSLSVHLSKLRNTVRTRNLNESGGAGNVDTILRQRTNDIHEELKALNNQGNVRRLSISESSHMQSPMPSPPSSPIYSEYENFKNRKLLTSTSKPHGEYKNIVGGGDPLQELRIELGRL